MADLVNAIALSHAAVDLADSQPCEEPVKAVRPVVLGTQQGGLGVDSQRRRPWDRLTTGW